MSIANVLSNLDSLSTLPAEVRKLVEELSTNNDIEPEFRVDLEDLLRCSAALTTLYLHDFHDAKVATSLLGELLGIVARLQIYSNENKPERTAWGFVNTKTGYIHNYVYATEEAAVADLDELEAMFNTPGLLRVIPVNVTSNVAAMPKNSISAADRAIIPEAQPKPTPTPPPVPASPTPPTPTSLPEG